LKTLTVDMWALGCIFAELLALKPIFKGEEVKMDNKKTVPFQRGQMQKIMEILGTPTRMPPENDIDIGDKWPSLQVHPEYTHLTSFKQYSNNLKKWYMDNNGKSQLGFDLLSKLFEYDPNKRITAMDALHHEYFSEDGGVTDNVFDGKNVDYPSRKVTEQERDIVRTGSGRVGAESVKRGMASHGGGGGDAKRAKTGA
jgi:cyclin-dependent kinase 8/11